MNPDYLPPNPSQQFAPAPMVGGEMQQPQSGNKKRLVLLLAGIVALLVISGGVVLLVHNSSPSTDSTAVALSSKVADVSIDASNYMPTTITVKRGQQVTWTNDTDTPRQLATDPTMLPGFNTVEPLDQGDSYSYIFDKTGTYKYYDPADPTVFVGTINVQ